LQETYKRVARPITDIITRAFTGVVDRVNKLLQNPQIIRGFRNIAVEVARSIRQATGEAGGARSVGVFETLQREAAHNLPTVTRIAVNFFRTLRSLVVDALPAFRLLLGYIDGYARNLRRAVETRPGQLTNFFKEGVRYANQFFKLGLAVVRLFLAIGGRGGAVAEGTRTIQDLTGYVDHLTDRVNHNAGSIRRFFASTHDSVKEVLSVLGALGTTLLQAFNPQSIKILADFLKEIIIPALGTTIQFMGVLVNTFHQFLTLPGVTQLAKLGVTLLLLAKGLEIINHAVTGVLQILPNMLKAFGILVPVVDEATGAVTGFELAAGGPILIAIAAVIAAIILLDKHFHFLGPTFRWLKNAASDAFDWIKKAGRSLVRWFSDVWTQGVLYWIRAPFIAAYKWFSGGTLGKAIIRDFTAVIRFFAGPVWKSLKALFIVPFEAMRIALDVIWGLIRSAFVVFADVFAGRFDRLGKDLGNIWKGVWDGIKGAFKDAVNALIDIVNSAIDRINQISPFGDIGHIGKLGDDTAKATDKATEAQKRSNKAVKEALPNLVTLKGNYDLTTQQLDRLRPGTDAYKDAVKRAKRAHDDYNDALHTTAQRATDAKEPVRTIRRNIGQLGDVSADTAKAVADNLNDVLKQMGARTIRINTRAYRRSGIDRLTDVTGHGATGGVLSRSSGLHQRFWGGGIPNSSGGAADDHILYSPMGAPVAALSGTEGIVNRPQMHIIDSALGMANALGAMPWGSLNDLWGSGMRHYQGGGKLQLPTNFSATHQTAGLPGYPAIDVFARPGTQVGSPIAGRVVKLSGRPPSAGAYEGAGGPFGWSEYISGSGRTYFLTHFGSRSVSLGQRVRYGQTIGTVGNYPGGVPDHIHEGLHGAGMAVTGSPGAVASINAPRITGDTGPLGRLARASARVLARAANAYLARNIATFGAGDSRGIDLGDFRGGTATGNGAGLMRQIARRRGWNFNDWWAIDARETGHGANLVNPTSTARLRGQFLSSNWGKYGPGSDPRRHPSMAQQIQSMAAYIDQRYGNPTRAEAHERAFGWYKRGGPLRRLQTGGPLKGVTRTPVATARPRNPLIAGSFSASLGQISSIMATITDALSAVSRRSLRRVHNLATGIAGAFDKLTGDNGVLDLMQTTVESIASFAAVRLQQMQFRVTRAGARRTYVSPAALAQDNLQTLQATRGGLTDERTVLQGSLTDAQRALNEAQRRGNARATRVARAAIRNLTQRIEKNVADLAQNAQDQVEAQESFQQALVDSVNTAADQQSNAIDRWQRVARAFGRSLDPNVVVGAQIANMQRQIGGLRGVLRRAIRTGNLDLATSVRSQIDELNTQIAEAVAQQFQNSIDAVNNQAQRSLGANDRVARRAQIGGTDFGVLGTALQQRGGILNTQRAGLLGLLAQAQASGNIDQVISLTDQIDELNTQLLENTQAIKDNTDAGFNARTQQINDTFGFAQSLFSGAQGFFQALTEATGIDTSGQQRASLAGVGTGLATQRQGLTGQIATLLGLSPQDLANLQQLNPADLVNYLVSIASGPAFDAIMARLDPTQQQSFRDLVTALLGNLTATEQNTQALQTLSGNNAQSFSSSFWTAFRRAVFTGNGQLLPQFAMTIPGADVGARVLQSGALMVHAGESVRPATVSRDWRESGGDEYNLYVTTPTEVLDPTDVGRQLAFHRKTGGRG
jgi:predicted  nucleic acid-binding Zn-ribbon protein